MRLYICTVPSTVNLVFSHVAYKGLKYRLLLERSLEPSSKNGKNLFYTSLLYKYRNQIWPKKFARSKTNFTFRSMCEPQFVIKDQDGNVALRIEGPFCTFSICGDVEFKVMSPDGSAEIGKMYSESTGYYGIITGSARDRQGIDGIDTGASSVTEMRMYESMRASASTTLGTN